MPKFDSDMTDSPKDHISQFFLFMMLSRVYYEYRVQHEDIMCRLFPQTFESKESTWYYHLQPASITSWVAFKNEFLEKFGEKKRPRDLMLSYFHYPYNQKNKSKTSTKDS